MAEGRTAIGPPCRQTGELSVEIISLESGAE